MKKLVILFSLALSLLLTGCGPVYQTTYSYEKPASQRARTCIASNCERNKMLCQSNCAKNNNECEWRATEEAKTEYREYVRQQRYNNLPIKKSINDFKDDWDCNNSCNCQSVYRQCYSTCGGTVIAHTQCVAFCNQKQ